jgi:hypothetical protein
MLVVPYASAKADARLALVALSRHSWSGLKERNAPYTRSYCAITLLSLLPL